MILYLYFEFFSKWFCFCEYLQVFDVHCVGRLNRCLYALNHFKTVRKLNIAFVN